MTRRTRTHGAKIRTAVFSAGIAAGALLGPGLAQAYPPDPETQPPSVDSGNPDDAGTPIVDANAPSDGDSLPATGNSDIAPSLMIAGAALLAGLAITGAATASSRRNQVGPKASTSSS